MEEAEVIKDLDMVVLKEAKVTNIKEELGKIEAEETINIEVIRNTKLKDDLQIIKIRRTLDDFLLLHNLHIIY